MEDLKVKSSETVQEDTQEEKKWCVYVHTNKINGKKYVGITSRPVEDRWKNGNGYSHDQSYFYRAINKYTWDGFLHEVVANNLTEVEAKYKEIELIALYKSNCRRYHNPTYGYNMTDGGDGTVGRIHTDDTKQKISNALKGRKMSQESRQKMSESRKGVPFSEEHKRNLSKSQIGRKHSDETRNKISNSKIGKYTGKNNPNYNNHKLSGKNNPNYGNCGEKHPAYGRKHTAEELEKMKNANIGEKNPMFGKYGINNPHTILVYCVELNQIFSGAADAERKTSVSHQAISKCCKGKRKTSGKHPITKDPLHWVYVYDKIEKDNSVINGAITLEYITEEQVDNYLNDLKGE